MVFCLFFFFIIFLKHFSVICKLFKCIRSPKGFSPGRTTFIPSVYPPRTSFPAPGHLHGDQLGLFQSTVVFLPLGGLILDVIQQVVSNEGKNASLNLLAMLLVIQTPPPPQAVYPPRPQQSNLIRRILMEMIWECC